MIPRFESRALFCFGLLLTFSLALPAVAQEAESAAGGSGYYLDLGAGARHVVLPKVKGGLANPNDPEGSVDDATGYGFDVTLGRQFQSGLIGENSRVEVRGRFTFAEERDRDSTGGDYGQMPIDGSGPSGGGAGTRAITKVEYEEIDLSAVLVEDVVSSDSLTASVLAGVAYTHSEQKHRIFGPDFDDFGIKDDVDTNYAGVVLGGGAGLKLPGELKLRGDVEVGLLYADADFDARQNFGGPRLKASDSDDDFAARVRGSLGLERRFGIAVLGLAAHADYLSYAPRVVHPTRDLDPFESKLEDDDLVVVGGTLTVGFRF
ncbi:MAG: hypothetical protein MJE66_18195 [Proteobacteria bacterium]|nr:hypothetical protein [Pseudomonadota bacterium]